MISALVAQRQALAPVQLCDSGVDPLFDTHVARIQKAGYARARKMMDDTLHALDQFVVFRQSAPHSG